MDSLVIRLHNLKENYPIIWQVGKQTEVGNLLVATRAPKPSEPINTVKSFWLNYREGSAIPLRFSDKLKVPSSNHEIPYWIDERGNYLEFNVSLPKFCFGNNVLEVITPPAHRNFSVNRCSPYDHIDFWYELIREVSYSIIMMISHNSLPDGINWNDLEVARIDFAINQVFMNKVEAVKYMKHQGGIQKRHQRRDATGRQILYEDETLFFPSEHYTVKIYHKGQEFDRIQSKKIIELNKKRKAEAKLAGKEPELLSSNIKYSDENIKQLQAYADKILRYEFTYRPGYMSYIFNRRINKHWSKHFILFKRIYDYLERNLDNKKFLLQHVVVYVDILGNEVKPDREQFNDMLGAKLTAGKAIEKKYFVQDNIEVGFEGSGIWKEVRREFTEKEYLFMRILRKYGVVDRKDLTNWLTIMERELHQVRQFRWRNHNERDTMVEGKKNKDGEIEYLNNALTKTPKYVRFSKTVMRFMLTELEKFFNNFQIDTKPSHLEFIDKIAKYNQVISNRLLVALNEADRKQIEKLYIKPRTERSLIEYNYLFAKLNQKQMKERYQKTSYHRLLKLHKLLTGSNYQISHAVFGDVNRDFNTLYRGLYLEMERGYLLKFYNTAFAGVYKV